MISKRPFIPYFLQKFDDKLLRNKPNAWSARTHFVLYFSGLFAVCLFALCFFSFSDARQNNNIEIWTIFVSLIVFIGMIFWLIFLLRFNVFKRYGDWKRGDGIKSFALYFVSISAMVSIAFIPYLTEIISANNAYEDSQITSDINEINTTVCQLEYDELPKEWKADTCYIQNYENATRDNYYEEDATTHGYNRQTYHMISTKELNRRLILGDSCKKINTSTYIFYNCPNYEFIYSYEISSYHQDKIKIFNSEEIYNKVIKNYQKPDRRALLQKMNFFKDKYAVGRNYYGYSFNEEKLNYTDRIRQKYNLHEMNTGISNIISKKYKWVKDWPVTARVFFYISLILTLAVFIFRHTTIKTFFLSLLTAVILLILTSLIIAMGRFGDNIVPLNFILFYFLVFTIIAFTVKAAKVRSAIQGIALNSFTIAAPFVPLVIMAICIFTKERRSSYYYAEYTFISNKWVYYLSAEIGGLLIFLFLLEPVFRHLYRKWYALPED